MPVQHNHRGKLVLVVQEDGELRSLLCDVVRGWNCRSPRRLTEMEPSKRSGT